MKKLDYENIVLHYFTTKILALYSGFNEEESQFLAEITQFTSDNFSMTPIIVDIANDELIKRGIAVKADDRYKIILTRSSVSQANWFDINTLINKENQEKIFAPIHFFPPQKIKNEGGSLKPYSVDSESQFFDDLCFPDKRPEYVDVKRKDFLARVGVFLHAYIDMFTHELLCGLETTNIINLEKVLKEEISKEDITADYKKEGMPNVASAPLGRSLEECGIWIDFQIGSSNHPITTKERNIRIAKNIYIFLCKVCKILKRTPKEYPEAAINEQLKKVFGFYKNNENIEDRWKSVFENGRIHFNTKFKYDADEVFKNLTVDVKRRGICEVSDPLTQFLLAISDLQREIYE